MALQIKVAALGAPGRTLLLDPRSLLLGEMVWDRKLLPGQPQRTGIGDHEGANHMRGVGRTEATADARSNVPTMGAVARVSQLSHQFREGRCGPPELPPGLPYRSGKPEAGQRRDNQIEGVLGIAPVGPWITERADQVSELDYRGRVAVGDQQRQRVWLGRADVQIVDWLPVYLGDELRNLVESGLLSSPVEAVAPVIG